MCMNVNDQMTAASTEMVMTEVELVNGHEDVPDPYLIVVLTQL